MNVKPYLFELTWYFYDNFAGCGAPTFVNNFIVCNPEVNCGRFGDVVITFP